MRVKGVPLFLVYHIAPNDYDLERPVVNGIQIIQHVQQHGGAIVFVPNIQVTVIQIVVVMRDDVLDSTPLGVIGKERRESMSVYGFVPSVYFVQRNRFPGVVER